MYSCIKTCTLQGLEGYVIDVETDLSRSLPKFSIVGLPDIAIKESAERVRAAIKNSRYDFPMIRITINLAPANIKKDGTQMDLAIATSILSASGQIDSKDIQDYIFLGELSLDGKVNRIDGALPMVISLREMGFRKIIVPYDNRKECAVVEDMEIYPVKELSHVVDFFNGDLIIEREVHVPYSGEGRREYSVDFSEMKGQDNLKRALEISAAGSHNLLMIGTPGCGKSMAAKRLPTILPKLTFEEAIEVTKIYSVSGLLSNEDLVYERPFRSPHHTSSAVSLIGGGRIPKPGEISLAHHGVLYLDELPEFSRHVLEVLRQPMEDHTIHIARANASLTYPAKFMLIASMNPCKCGYNGHPTQECTCSVHSISQYLSKISHPLLDRIDLHVDLSPVNYEDIAEKREEEKSICIRERVEKARNIQLERFKDFSYFSNSDMSEKDVKKFCQLSKSCEELMKIAFKKYNFSGRSYHKILKVARTIADLAGKVEIQQDHLLEAIRYRSVEAKYWGSR
ncbi:MAG: YifB family Mg chelatase-like AAA ATPase [Tissierellia bacterium]|nr:YifB family Mg chelatase-like AAA ATPase [Tissierellia bacterium]